MGNSKQTIKCQKRKKAFAVERFGGECCICGYKKCLGSLVFHHLGSKKERPAYIIARWSWEKSKKELDKCILVCSNCHGEIHYDSETDISFMKYYKPFIIKECPICKNKFETKKYSQIYCSNICSKFSRRKAKRPNKKGLKTLLDQKISWVKLGKMFGVSGNAVKKWAKLYELL